MALFFIFILVAGAYFFKTAVADQSKEILSQKNYWFLLHRKSNKEFLYFGEPGKANKSALVKNFDVKTGAAGKRPTPLPQLLGREYWLVVDKIDSKENPETAPYFLSLDIPISEEAPFGPRPYLECDGQCNWELPGKFGLHGVGGDNRRLSMDDPGSSGCVRHKDEDIRYLYNLLDPGKSEIRYYVEDV